jgi:hypothetical protein
MTRMIYFRHLSYIHYLLEIILPSDLLCSVVEAAQIDT